MSAVDTIDRAAAGELPAWARLGSQRRAHVARVAALLDAWSRALGLPAAEAARWRAAAWLHDALKDADPASLRAELEPDLAALPGPVLHGPAAARRLAAEGVEDRELLDAIAFHSLGHPHFRRLGRALYAADFLEPGRTFAPLWCATLRARMPASLDAVLREIVPARVCHLMGRGRAVRPETLHFWNGLVGEETP